MMRRRRIASGFTLMEVGLAMAVSFVILAGVVAFYRQVRDDAGDAGMRSRISALAVVVEELYSSKGQYPNSSDLWLVWPSKRPDDYAKSPYGGDVNTDSGSPWAQNGVVAKSLTEGTQEPFAEESVITQGGLYYYWIVNNTNGNPKADGTAQMWDMTTRGEVTVRGFGVAGLKTSYKHFMVTSGR